MARTSVVHIRRAWYPVALDAELRATPLRRVVLGRPLAIFRDHTGAPAALLDRCPHRNVPLSLGDVQPDGTLACAYHGWRFAADGTCTEIPGLCSGHSPSARAATAFPTRLQDGIIWVWADHATPPDRDPLPMPLLHAPGYRTVTRRVEAPACMHATIENALDVPHTAFLHRGLFRDGGRRRIDVEVRTTADRIEVDYRGESRPEGLVGKLLSPSGGLVEHTDRFIAPNLLQVEYRIGDENHILVTAAACPIEDHRTALFAVVSYRTRLPGALLEPVAVPLAMRIFNQDVGVLQAQTDTVTRFGEERFQSTELDAVGPGMLAILRRLERAERPDHNPDAATDAAPEPTTRAFVIEV